MSMLFGTKPVITTQEAIAAVGFNEAHVLQQIYYWCEVNRQADRNFYDGRYWTYNTYEDWHKEFFWWSESTIRRMIGKLESIGVVISGEYNTAKFDHTKWYTVDEVVLERLQEEGKEKLKRIAQNDQIDTFRKNSAIPKISKQRITPKLKKSLCVGESEEESVINSENAVSDSYVKCARGSNLPAYDSNISWAVKIVDEYINEWYQEEAGKRHIQIASLSAYADRLVECQQILEHDRGAETEPEDFEKALKTAVKWHDCKDPTIMWATSPKVLGYWLVESGVCYYQDVMGTMYGFSDDAEEAYAGWGRT